jgi:hypothetical protein
MKLTRLYTGSDEESHFEDLGNIFLDNMGQLGKLSSKLKTTGMLILIILRGNLLM